MRYSSTPTIPLEGDLPGSAAGAAYAETAQALLSQHGSRGLVLITSPQPAVGRTTTAANLSLAFRAKGASVLLLELTNSLPRLESTFGISPFHMGTEAVLEGKASSTSVLCCRADNGLNLAMMKRQTSLNLQEPGRRNRLDQLLQMARSSFEWTVIDGPSQGDESALLELASRVSQVIIVAGRRVTRRLNLEAMAMLLGTQRPYILLNN